MVERKPDGSEKKLMDRLHSDVKRAMDSTNLKSGIELVVGIPFQNEDDTLPGVIRTAVQGIKSAGLARRALVVFVGGRPGASTLKKTRDALDRDSREMSLGFTLGRELEAPGWSIRALAEIAARMKAPLVLLTPDLVPQQGGADRFGEGYSPSWITKLLNPITEQDTDLVLARFTRHPLSNPVESLLAYPLMGGVFGQMIRQPVAMVCAISYRLILECQRPAEDWASETGIFGFYPWIITRALTGGFGLCEVPLGIASFRHSITNLKLIFRLVTHIIMEQIEKHAEWWLSRGHALSWPCQYGSVPSTPAVQYSLNILELQRRFRMEFSHFDETLFSGIVPDDLRKRMEDMIDAGKPGTDLGSEEWIHILESFILACTFDRRFHRDDIVDGLFPFFLARLVSYTEEVQDLERSLVPVENHDAGWMRDVTGREAQFILDQQTNLFIQGRDEFSRAWDERSALTESYLPRVGSWEFIPQVGVIVPQEIKGPDGHSVWAHQIYQKLMDRYRGEFKAFALRHLGMEDITSSAEVIERVRRFMREMDRVLDVDVFPHDISTPEGMAEMCDSIMSSFAPEKTFQLATDTCSHLLRRVPPANLITQLKCTNVAGLLEMINPNDALAMAAWTDRHYYLSRILDIIQEDGDPQWFYEAPLKPVVVDYGQLTNATEVRGTAALARLAGRVLAGNLQRGWGGEYARLWTFLKIIKSIVGVELFAEAWKLFSDEELDFSHRVVSSIRGHWGRHVLSAHNVFENRHQRILASRLRSFAEKLDSDGMQKAGEILGGAVDVYHVSTTLPDMTFVPLSAWTWASYSSRGGAGAPTPLSSLVERDWATRDFLVEYLTSAGIGNEEGVDRTVMELMGEGRESEDLGRILLGVPDDADDMVLEQRISPTPPLPAGKLTRPVDGPILEPVSSNAWESRYVLNAAAIRLDGKVHILYRAFGRDEISRIGLAWTADGVNIDGRMKEPVFMPADESEKAGCEDPRVTLIGERIFMLYTAYDGKLPQIALASIDANAFLERRFDQWERHGPAFPGLPNKDAVLYPELFDGKYVLYHRIDPNMWISYLEELSCPFPRENPRIVVGPRAGMMWDGLKIGAGAQPIKTEYGWLNIYHGVDFERTYRLGVLFMDLKDPSRVLYQSPNSVLEPEADFEVGHSESGDFWVSRVVFTCGAVPAQEKDVLGIEDEILVYYGAADTAIGVARGKVGDLVPVLRLEDRK